MKEDWELAQARARCNAATPGPWCCVGGDIHEVDPGPGASSYIGEADEHNARFIAAARTDLPRALDEIEYQRAIIKDQREQIERMRPVFVASMAMRKGHEGCVTDPPCGNCFRCDFDRAVDVALAEPR